MVSDSRLKANLSSTNSSKANPNASEFLQVVRHERQLVFKRPAAIKTSIGPRDNPSSVKRAFTVAA